ncbi:MAG: hypothetical protein V4577_24180 [Bacteroidota bacterium]
MKTRQYLILFLIFFGELLIVLGFLHFSLFTPGRIVTLNIVVTSITFQVYMLNLLWPGYSFRDRPQKIFAGLGIRGYAILLYSIAAIALMISMNGILSQSFSTQLLVHAVLLFLLGLGIIFSLTATDKAAAVYQQQTAEKAPLEDARRLAGSIGEKSQQSSLPPPVKDRLAKIGADLRYISPAGTAEALLLEDQLLGTLHQLDAILSLPAPDEQKVNELIVDFESHYRQRKQVYSY